ncbi:energy-coupling factor transporter ATPase [Evansella cellulosilytica]|uniref:Energy-coupling factor transporter ATP-binding protein EcfA2 n=1 Tax=Evansella cellulosilytica (strain ATCC 21833 / DSM 2522 / FERM P-1141 / JCM 9156 / N-4) TaxID=649639 RepID=E6TTA3_EVAC2|nr:energy-coupling factor transporter ATPase [Evansella cellulosilytica]ADU28443.1 ABC transporter related protein [Evansella cellulosilytica DSM 2522]
MQIKTEALNYTYKKNTPFEKKAIRDINVTIPANSFNVMIGKTGSGKSTLLQLLNGMLVPTSGNVVIGEYTINSKIKKKSLHPIRKVVGTVFQNPENQLFSDTVLQDVMYGPLNFGFTKRQSEAQAREAMELVGIAESLFSRSPFQLSGGQMRRVAIAGVLACQPKVLFLDEPTAGLDPQGHDDIMTLFQKWYKEREDRSIILITHEMEDAAKYGDNIYILHEGEIVLEGHRTEIFQQVELLDKLGLDIPVASRLLSKLKEASGENIAVAQYDVQGVVKELLSFIGRNKKDV